MSRGRPMVGALTLAAAAAVALIGLASAAGLGGGDSTRLLPAGEPTAGAW